MEHINESTQSIALELRRGIIILAVLSQLEDEQYGYSLLKRLSDQGLELDQGTLYPLLRRLEAQGLLQSDWRIVDDARPRRYYQINDQGRSVLVLLKVEWTSIAETLNQMLFAK